MYGASQLVQLIGTYIHRYDTYIEVIHLAPWLQVSLFFYFPPLIDIYVLRYYDVHQKLGTRPLPKVINPIL